MNAKVDVVGYRPKFDQERNLWYCDILLEPDTAYFPMVRLALARFQPISVEGAHISPVVLADFIQVAPHREVRYDATKMDEDGTLSVEVAGPTYLYRQLETRGMSQMILRLEQRSAVGAEDELGWEPISAHLMRSREFSPERTVWELTVQTPLPRPKPMRVVVLEVERYQADGRGDSDVLNVLKDVGLSGIVRPELVAVEMPLGYRVTFADAIELP